MALGALQYSSQLNDEYCQVWYHHVAAVHKQQLQQQGVLMVVGCLPRMLA